MIWGDDSIFHPCGWLMIGKFCKELILGLELCLRCTWCMIEHDSQLYDLMLVSRHWNCFCMLLDRLSLYYCLLHESFCFLTPFCFSDQLFVAIWSMVSVDKENTWGCAHSSYIMIRYFEEQCYISISYSLVSIQFTFTCPPGWENSWFVLVPCNIEKGNLFGCYFTDKSGKSC